MFIPRGKTFKSLRNVRFFGKDENFSQKILCENVNKVTFAFTELLSNYIEKL